MPSPKPGVTNFRMSFPGTRGCHVLLLPSPDGRRPAHTCSMYVRLVFTAFWMVQLEEACLQGTCLDPSTSHANWRLEGHFPQLQRKSSGFHVGFVWWVPFSSTPKGDFSAGSRLGSCVGPGPPNQREELLRKHRQLLQQGSSHYTALSVHRTASLEERAEPEDPVAQKTLDFPSWWF